MKKYVKIIFVSLIAIVCLCTAVACGQQGGETKKTVSKTYIESLEIQKLPTASTKGELKADCGSYGEYVFPLPSFSETYVDAEDGLKKQYWSYECRATCTAAGEEIYLLEDCDELEQYFADNAPAEFTAESGISVSRIARELRSDMMVADDTSLRSVVNNLDALGHDYQNQTYTWDGDYCKAKAVCSRCDEETTDCVLGEFVEDTPATCTQAALGHKKATFTGIAFTEQVTATDSATSAVSPSHKYNEADVTYQWNNDQCTARVVCERDSAHILTETVTGVFVEDTPADCNSPARGHYKATFSNAIFGEKSNDTDSVVYGNPNGHVFVDYDYSSRTETEWTARCTCSVCGEEETETVLVNYVVDVAADCYNPEYGHYEAVFTKSIFASQQTTSEPNGSPLEHDFNGVTPVYTWNGGVCTATITCARDNTHVETEIVNATYVMDTEATCIAYETGHYEATFTHPEFSEQATAIGSVVGNVYGAHDYTDQTPTYTWHYNHCVAEIGCFLDNTHLISNNEFGTFDATNNCFVTSSFTEPFTNQSSPTYTVITYGVDGANGHYTVSGSTDAEAYNYVRVNGLTIGKTYVISVAAPLQGFAYGANGSQLTVSTENTFVADATEADFIFQSSVDDDFWLSQDSVLSLYNIDDGTLMGRVVAKYGVTTRDEIEIVGHPDFTTFNQYEGLITVAKNGQSLAQKQIVIYDSASNPWFDSEESTNQHFPNNYFDTYGQWAGNLASYKLSCKIMTKLYTVEVKDGSSQTVLGTFSLYYGDKTDIFLGGVDAVVTNYNSQNPTAQFIYTDGATGQFNGNIIKYNGSQWIVDGTEEDIDDIFGYTIDNTTELAFIYEDATMRPTIIVELKVAP